MDDKTKQPLTNMLINYERGLIVPAIGSTPLLLTVPQACDLLGIGRTLCWELLYRPSNPIPHIRLGSRVLIPLAALEAWVVANTTPAENPEETQITVRGRNGHTRLT